MIEVIILKDGNEVFRQDTGLDDAELLIQNVQQAVRDTRATFGLDPLQVGTMPGGVFDDAGGMSAVVPDSDNNSAPPAND